MGKTLTFAALCLSCFALLIVPAFLVSFVFLGKETSLEEMGASPGAHADPPPRNPAEVLYAYEKLDAARAFRVKVTNTFLSRPPEEGRIEYLAPERFRLLFEPVEMIMIGPATYVRTNSKWVSIGVSVNLCFVNPKTLKAGYQSSTQQQFIGSQVLDGTPTYLFHYQLTCPDAKHSVRVWIGSNPTDGFPRRLESTAANGTKTTVTYYDFNAAFTINAP